MKTEKEYIEAEDALRKAGWAYLGAGEWNDPIANVTLLTSTAYQVMMARAKRIKIFKSIKMPKRKPRLIMCHDWRGIASEMKQQLKPFGLTVKVTGNYKKWGDALDWQVLKLDSE